jgi:hypothetical protein
MKISSAIHGVLDYATVLVLFVAPSVFNMQTTASFFTYVLASVHLLLTLLTNFEAGVLKIIPLKVHGLIEIVVSVLLIAIAIWFKSLGDNLSFYFYLVFSVVLFIVWLLTEYKPKM